MLGLVGVDRRRRLGACARCSAARCLPAEAVQYRLLQKTRRSTRTSRRGWETAERGQAAAAYKDAQASGDLEGRAMDVPDLRLQTFRRQVEEGLVSGIFVLPDGQMPDRDEARRMN